MEKRIVSVHEWARERAARNAPGGDGRGDARPRRGADRVQPGAARRARAPLVGVTAEPTRRVAVRLLAAGVDRELRRLGRVEGLARRACGTVAQALIARRGWQRLGFARLGDYARERVGLAARTLESAAAVAATLATLPALAQAFEEGGVGWTQVRLVATVARPDDEARWLALARSCDAVTLAGAVAAAQGGRAAPVADPEDDDTGMLDGEPAARLRIVCPRRLRVLWRAAVALARRVAGEQLAPWQAAEAIAAEGIAGRPLGAAVGDRATRTWAMLGQRSPRVPRVGDATPRRDGRPRGGRGAAHEDTTLHAAGAGAADRSSSAGGPADGSSSAAGARGVADDAAARDAAADIARRRTALGAPVDADVEAGAALLPWTAAELAAADAFALDARLRVAVGTLRTLEPRLGLLLRLVVDQRLYRALGYRSLDAYVRTRLGLSVRKTWALVRLERHACRVAAFGEAYATGRLSWVQALTLLPVLDERTAGAWIARAARVTVHRLVDEVNWVCDARDSWGADVPPVPPPLGIVLTPVVATGAGPDATETGGVGGGDGRDTSPAPGGPRPDPVQIGADGVAANAVTKSGTAGAGREIVDADVTFVGPASVVALFRDAVALHVRPGEPRWRALERLVVHVMRDWEALPRHRDPVFARDGWRCTVPGSSARRNLHDHHLRFRSAGGDHRRSNRVTVCAAHHLHGIHAGVVRASGTAPQKVCWELGVRRNGPPLLRFVGDCMV